MTLANSMGMWTTTKNKATKQRQQEKKIQHYIGFTAALDFEKCKTRISRQEHCTAVCSYLPLCMHFGSLAVLFFFVGKFFGCLISKCMHYRINAFAKQMNDRFGSWLLRVLLQFSYGFRMTPMCVCFSSCMYSYRPIVWNTLRYSYVHMEMNSSALSPKLKWM